MSYLNLAAGVPDFSKAVFSFWFRVPRQSVLAVVQRTLADPADFKYMQYILPLVTFGKPQQNKNYQAVITDVAVYHYTPETHVPYLTPSSYAPGEPYEVDPCLIGALCHDDGTFDMTFNIQMGDHGTYSSLVWLTTQLDLYSHDDPNSGYDPAEGSGWGGYGFAVAHSTIEEESHHIQDAQPEVFLVETRLDTPLEPDKWHHLLLSFDVSGMVSIGEPYASSDCQLWYAIDDVDYRGALNLRPYRVEGDGLGSNTIVTKNCFDNSGEFTIDLYQNHYIPDPSGSYEPEPIPTAGEHFGIPAVPRYVDRIFRVEMAEFQLFTGVTLDTAITSNRRAFINDDGEPVLPEAAEGEPMPAEQLLGKKPDILLHGSDDWIDGANTGTVGVEQGTEGTDTEIPAGQFTPTGGIEPFEPDPSLEPSTA